MSNHRGTPVVETNNGMKAGRHRAPLPISEFLKIDQEWQSFRRWCDDTGSDPENSTSLARYEYSVGWLYLDTPKWIGNKP